MNNRVVASVSFSFKGKVHQLSMAVDLDRVMEQQGEIPLLYPLLADRYGFDLYSYEYEMMMAEPVQFSEAEGMAADYLDEGVFDVEGFSVAWHESRVLTLLGMIAESEMGVDDLAAHPGLKRALTEAYLCGKEGVSQKA